MNGRASRLYARCGLLLSATAQLLACSDDDGSKRRDNDASIDGANVDEASVPPIGAPARNDAGLAVDDAGVVLSRCRAFQKERMAFFGDLHVHTALSLDANLQGTRLRPADSYRFARGERVDLPPYDANGKATRSLQLDRPLDFVAVSDHAEFLGLVNTCTSPGTSGYDSLECIGYRSTPDVSFFGFNLRLSANVDSARHASPCVEANGFCGEAAKSSWQEVISAAEQSNDTSGECAFTAFIGYEWSGSPDTRNLHRNVIFRGSKVPTLPFSYFEGGRPEQLWESLQSGCLSDPECDVLTIPHNSNLSAGLMFEPVTRAGEPFDAAYAKTRAKMEPLAEIIQHKGSSECLADMGPDEQCSFELMPYNTLGSATLAPAPDTLLARDMLRDALGQGLKYEQTLGVNPFAYGFVGGTDSHLGLAGGVDEDTFQGHGGAGSNARNGVVGLVDKLWFNPGGLTVLWAEENTRDALFAAMRRKEAYATSGPRMTLRFFAGSDLPENMCERNDFVATGYSKGVPMGGVLAKSKNAPRLFVRAERDPGSARAPGVGLDRIQIIKGFLRNGEPQYRVFDLAGQGDSGSVDAASCTPSGPSADALCATFRDPEFEADTQAFYYARVLENPTCRWQAHACLAAGVVCGTTVPKGFEGCCDKAYPRTHQERAWSSPIFYRPGK